LLLVEPFDVLAQKPGRKLSLVCLDGVEDAVVLSSKRGDHAGQDR
jgi:hypothetical protein